MKGKKHAPFTLSPYSKFDGYSIIICFSFFSIFSAYQAFLQVEVTFVIISVVSALTAFVFHLPFVLPYQVIQLQNDNLTVTPWLRRTKYYSIESIVNFRVVEKLMRGIVRTDVVIELKNGEQITVTGEYYSDYSLQRLHEALKRYGVKYVGLIEAEGKHSFNSRFSYWAWAISQFIIMSWFLGRHLWK